MCQCMETLPAFHPIFKNVLELIYYVFMKIWKVFLKKIFINNKSGMHNNTEEAFDKVMSDQPKDGQAGIPL